MSTSEQRNQILYGRSLNPVNDKSPGGQQPTSLPLVPHPLRQSNHPLGRKIDIPPSMSGIGTQYTIGHIPLNPITVSPDSSDGEQNEYANEMPHTSANMLMAGSQPLPGQVS
jgi:hypothetical protein